MTPKIKSNFRWGRIFNLAFSSTYSFVTIADSMLKEVKWLSDGFFLPLLSSNPYHGHNICTVKRGQNDWQKEIIPRTHIVSWLPWYSLIVYATPVMSFLWSSAKGQLHPIEDILSVHCTYICTYIEHTEWPARFSSHLKYLLYISELPVYILYSINGLYCRF